MRVTYERLFNLGNYNNERIALEDEVQPGETAFDAYWRLRAELYAMADHPDPVGGKPTIAPLEPGAGPK